MVLTGRGAPIDRQEANMTKSSTRKTAARKPIIRAPALRKRNDAQRIVLSSAA